MRDVVAFLERAAEELRQASGHLQRAAEAYRSEGIHG